jgi:hypothetical protein
MEEANGPRRAYTIKDLIDAGYGSRQSIYRLINEGQLIARKRGRSTIILDDDLQACVRSLPRLSGGRAA